jgi:transposase
MAILELKAARGWSLEQTAKAFLVTAATIATWMKRLDEEGPHALVQLRHPVNKFPELVCYIVQRFKRFCPAMGKVKIAQTLARAGLHLGPTTVGRMLKEETASLPTTRRGKRPAGARSGDHGQVPWARLARRSHHRANRLGLLVFVVAVCRAAILAILLVGGGCRRSLLTSCDRRHRVQEPALLRSGARVPWTSHCQGQEDASVHCL